MSTPEIKVRHGNFFDLDGPPQKYGEFTFAAARVELLGTITTTTVTTTTCVVSVIWISSCEMLQCVCQQHRGQAITSNH